MSLTIAPSRIVEESTSPLLAAPDSWTRTPLGEIATIVNGGAFKSAQFATGSGKPLIRIRDLLRDATSVGFEGDYEVRYLVQPGDLLIGMDGDFNSARWHGPEALLNQRVCKIVPDSNRLDLDFLTHILPGYLRAVHDATSSTTVTHLSSRDIAQIPIPVPTLEEQRSLARVFDAASAKEGSASLHIGSARRAIDRFRQSVLAAACSGRLTADWRGANATLEPAEALISRSIRKLEAGKHALASQEESWTAPDWLELPNSWRWAPLKELAIIRGGIQKQPKRTPRNNAYPYLRVANVLRDKLDLSEIKRFELFDREIEIYRLERGDLLVVEGNGSAKEIGRCAIWRGEIPDCVHQNHIIRVRCIEMDPEFVSLFWNSPIGAQEIASLAVTTAGLYSLSTKKVASVVMPVPPLEEQREVVRQSAQLLKIASGLDARFAVIAHDLARCSQAVLTRAFRGEFNFDAQEG